MFWINSTRVAICGVGCSNPECIIIIISAAMWLSIYVVIFAIFLTVHGNVSAPFYGPCLLLFTSCVDSMRILLTLKEHITTNLIRLQFWLIGSLVNHVTEHELTPFKNGLSWSVVEAVWSQFLRYVYFCMSIQFLYSYLNNIPAHPTNLANLVGMVKRKYIGLNKTL